MPYDEKFRLFFRLPLCIGYILVALLIRNSIQYFNNLEILTDFLYLQAFVFVIPLQTDPWYSERK